MRGGRFWAGIKLSVQNTDSHHLQLRQGSGYGETVRSTLLAADLESFIAVVHFPPQTREGATVCVAASTVAVSDGRSSDNRQAHAPAILFVSRLFLASRR